MQELKTDDVSVNQAGCIRKCGKGVVFKAFGGQLEESAPNGLIAWYPVVDDEQEPYAPRSKLSSKWTASMRPSWTA